MIKKKLIKLLSILLVIAGIVIGFLPKLNNYYYQQKSNTLITEYAKKADNKTLNKMWDAACKYNKNSQKAIFSDVFETKNEYSKEYMNLLNINNGMMGYITIPSINVQLPIYHGTSSEVLEKGVGHLQSSSLPVGGKGTHCVLSGHTGIDSSKMFNELTDLKIGDTFYLTVAGHELCYKVDNIATVLPTDTALLQKNPEKDYCTLVTCTPYGVNTHRLLVRGTRINNQTSESTVILEKSEDYTLIQLFAAIILSILFLCLIWRIYEKKNN